MTTPELVSVDTTPAIDPYHANTGGETWTQFFLDLRDGRHGIVQECDDNATPVYEWHGIVQTARLNTRPDEDGARAYLTGDALPLINRILDGGSVDWDGSNYVGHLDDDAQDAWNDLIEDLKAIPESEWTLWQIDEWLNGDCGVTANTTNAEIERIATEIEAAANGEKVILDGDVRDYLYDRRADQISDTHLTTAEAAALIGISDSHVRRMIGAGQIMAKKRGHDWQVRARDIDGITPKRARKATS